MPKWFKLQLCRRAQFDEIGQIGFETDRAYDMTIKKLCGWLPIQPAKKTLVHQRSNTRLDSSVGRALDWRSKGPWFNPGSRHILQKFDNPSFFNGYLIFHRFDHTGSSIFRIGFKTSAMSRISQYFVFRYSTFHFMRKLVYFHDNKRNDVAWNLPE